MDRSSEVRDFLWSRRARITPEQAGLKGTGARRRVPGLRREEVATLAGVTTDYYSRLERGNLRGVSQSVLDGLARALQLTNAERAHLMDLARNAEVRRPARAAEPTPPVRTNLAWMLEAMERVPAYIRNRRLDILCINTIGREVFSELVDSSTDPVNLARYLFLDARARSFYKDWHQVARETAGVIRTEVGRTPDDPQLLELVQLLCSGSSEFAGWWAAHDVSRNYASRKAFQHPLVGELYLNGEGFELPSDPDLRLIAYVAEPGSPSELALEHLLNRLSPSR